MAIYRYRAISDEGKVIKGEMDALNDFDLESQLKNSGLELIKATVIKTVVRPARKMPRRELINFLFQLEMLLRAGVPILAVLADLRDSAETPGMRNLCGGIYEKIDSGSSISEAFAANPGVFPELLINLVRAGEATGQLPEVIQEIGRSLKWQDELASKTKQLMMYPAFVLVVITSVVVFLMVFIVPQIVKFIVNMGQTVPLQTKILIWVSDAFVNYWWLILPSPAVIIILLMTVGKLDPRIQHKLHAAILAAPFIGQVIKKIILARVSDTLALTYRTGIPVLEGLDYCRNISGNLVIKEAIESARDRIANGAPISQGFASQMMFPSLVIRMLKVGEETGDLDGALKNISYFYNRDIDESIQRVQALIEPALTVVLGLIIGWVMLAVLGPIYDTISKIKM
ncbi:MAG: type II secretion system F family protein [Sideroxydans sp.]|nr:type II secretion system F family protein [Sideroxydans sp.]